MAKFRGSSRRSRSITPIDGWIIARKVVQGAALLGFLALIILSRRSTVAPEIISLPMRLDPLAVLAAFLSGKTFLVGSIAALSIVILTLVAGRAWCGWLCPLGTLLDVFSIRRNRSSFKPPETWRAVKYGLLLIILFMALFGSLTLLILDPLTILYRGFTLAIWPAIDQVVTSLQIALYPIPILSRAVIAFDRWIRPALLPSSPLYFREAFLFGAVLAGVILLNHFSPRFWCRYLCPLGGLLGWISRISIFRRQVDAECRQCGACERACPTGTIDPQRGYVSDPAECTLCLECFQSCPGDTIRLAANLSVAPRYEYDPGRRQVLTALGLSALAVALFRRDAAARHPNQFLLRPPGAVDDHLMQTCVRCGICMAACPTGALQPAINEAGIEGLWTPVIVPRMGYCSFACAACGSVCPVQAIPPLTLRVKRRQVIGKAYIDQNRCLAWSDLQNCIICEEMCPLSNKAIRVIRTEVTREEGHTVTVLQPFVDRQLCIGCGICEYKCPVGGEAAIRVYL
ncbi:MAG TPA: 4Fe-4S dicluster domain-containing protein [Levilinea sp.]|nr:4Fe-4S dicluster domain-containing protein [Levilinea sp.]